LSFSSVCAKADDAALEYRDFTGANGTTIQAVLVDKTDSDVTLLLKSGQRVALSYDKLSEADQKYAKEWSKEKAIFLQKCRSLTVRQLLELRGYESFKFRLDGNSMIVEGELNGNRAKFMIDTGAHSSVLHLDSAKETGCKVGPMDQKIYGIGGEAPAAWSDVEEIRLGESVIRDQKLLTADLMKDRPQGSVKSEDAIFGAEFLTQLVAVISYREGRVFLRPDLADGEGDGSAPEVPDFRLFKTDAGDTIKGNVLSKTSSAVMLKLENGQEQQFGISRLSPEDQEFVGNWSEDSATFMRYCRGLTVEQLLELRQYQSFEYDRRGNHIFVDGKLNEADTTFMIDTGAELSVLHVDDAEAAGCEVGPMDQKLYGVGGEAPAAVTKVALIQMGDAKIENRSVLSTDLFRNRPSRDDYGAIFGADFMRELDAVVTYRESRIFLRQD
jgi:predicted aspartyl protease